MSGNRIYRQKRDKHTTPPSDFAEKSWTLSGAYDLVRERALAAGNLYFDVDYNYFAAICDATVSGIKPRYSMSGVSGVAPIATLPLNSKLPELHPHFRVSTSGMIPIASGDVTVELSRVSGTAQKACKVWQSGSLMAEFHPSSGLVILT